MVRDGRDVTRMGVGNGEEPFRNLCWCLREVDGVPQCETWWVRIVITIYRTAVFRRRDGKFCLVFSDFYRVYLAPLRDFSLFHFGPINREKMDERKDESVRIPGIMNRPSFSQLSGDQVCRDGNVPEYPLLRAISRTPRPQSEEENDCPNVILRDSRLLRPEVS